MLGHDNAWQRETAQRLLSEQGKQDQAAPRQMEVTAERAKFDAILKNPDVGEPLTVQIMDRVSALRQTPNDPWTLKAVLSSSAHTSGRILAGLFDSEDFYPQFTAQKAEVVRSLASVSAEPAKGSSPGGNPPSCKASPRACPSLAASWA